MVERWYVTIRISETADGDYAATEPGQSRVGNGNTPIRALVDYARTVERAEPAAQADHADRAEHEQNRDLVQHE